MNESRFTRSLSFVVAEFQKVDQDGVGNSDKIHSTSCDGCCHYNGCSTSFLCSACVVHKELQLES